MTMLKRATIKGVDPFIIMINGEESPRTGVNLIYPAGLNREVKNGETVYIMEVNGSASDIVIIAIEDSLTETPLPIARKSDPVDAVIPAGTVIVSISGGSGSPAVGVLNPTAIVLTGEITDGSSIVTSK